MDRKQEIALKQRLVQLGKAQRFAEAERVARALLASFGNDLQLWFALAQMLLAQGKREEALTAFMRVSGMRSDMQLIALDKVTDLAQELGRFDIGFRAALVLRDLAPKTAVSHSKAGFFAWSSQRQTESLGFFQQAVNLEPDNVMFSMQLAKALTHQGKVEEALACYERVFERVGPDVELYSQYLYTLNYVENISEESLFQLHCKFGAKLEEAVPDKHIRAEPLLNRRIRIGYVSKDFCYHAVACFFIPLLEAHNAESFEIFCYSDVPRPDAVTAAIRSASEHWCDSVAMDDAALCQKIESDNIDVLVDLVGYAGGRRAGLFARRAAPVQVSYLGYPNTSGLSRMDYRITDNICDPEGESEQFYTENLIRLDDGFLSYRPLIAELDIVQAPCIENGYLTFGCFNVFPKVSESVLKSWCEILLALPDSKLLIKAQVFSEVALQDLVRSRFAKYGVTSERLIFKGRLDSNEGHFQEYSNVDVHLDTHPYNGTTTTCDALWMGVPTLCQLGSSHRSRVSASIMSRVDLAEFVCDGTEDYIQKAVDLAEDFSRLNRLRKGMRSRVLWSGKVLANALEEHYKKFMAAKK